MEEHTNSSNGENNSQMYYIIGAIVLVAVVGAGILLRPKTASAPATLPASTSQPAAAAPTTAPKGPITKLACETQYYNPVIGVPEQYYMSVEGAAPTGVNKVDCTFTASISGKIVATETSSADTSAVAERSGNVFRCVTKAMKLQRTVPTKVTVDLKDDTGATASCFRFFTLP